MITNRVRLQLVDTFAAVRPKDFAEQRANSRLYEQFTLLDVEATIAAFREEAARRPATTTEEATGINRLYQARLEEKFPASIETEIEISEGVARTFLSYFNRMAEIFPAVKTPDGVEVSAGLPMAVARILAPLCDALAEAFPDVFETKD